MLWKCNTKWRVGRNLSLNAKTRLAYPKNLKLPTKHKLNQDLKKSELMVKISTNWWKKQVTLSNQTKNPQLGFSTKITLMDLSLKVSLTVLIVQWNSCLIRSVSLTIATTSCSLCLILRLVFRTVKLYSTLVLKPTLVKMVLEISLTRLFRTLSLFPAQLPVLIPTLVITWLKSRISLSFSEPLKLSLTISMRLRTQLMSSSDNTTTKNSSGLRLLRNLSRLSLRLVLSLRILSSRNSKELKMMSILLSKKKNPIDAWKRRSSRVFTPSSQVLTNSMRKLLIWLRLSIRSLRLRLQLKLAGFVLTLLLL